MRVRVFAIAVLWALSLVGVSVWAQVRNPEVQMMPSVSAVISGADIGFRPGGNSSDPNKVAGRWMVRIDGQWRETTGPITTQRLN